METVRQMPFLTVLLIISAILLFVQVLALFLHVSGFTPLEVILLVAFPLLAYISALPVIGSFVSGPYHGLSGTVFATARVFDIPLFHLHGSVIGFNLLGCSVPVIITTKMLVQRRVPWKQFCIVAAIIAGVAHLYSAVVPGLGVTIYLFPIPSILAAGLAFMLRKMKGARSFNPALLSYAGATIGVLVGADLLNLYQLVAYHADRPVFISIGGGSALDAIFLAGIIAMLADLLFRSQEENVLQLLLNAFRESDRK